MNVDQLSGEVQKRLAIYQEELNGNVSQVFDEIADEALAEIRNQSQSAGFKDKHYSKGWAKIVKKDRTTGHYHVTIHNKKYYRLTHLLEKGHALKKGGRTRAFPHIAPTQAKMDRLVITKLEEAISK